MLKRSKISKKLLIIFAALVLIGLAEMTVIAFRLSDHNSNSQKNTSGKSTSNSDAGTTFNKSKYSINDPNSIWVVVNKGRVLPAGYVPPDLVTPNVPLRTKTSDPEMHLRNEAARALESLFSTASTESINFRLASGYRSYTEQVSIYASEVKSNGQAGADRESARPGHSEHQTGLAADLEPSTRLCEVEPCFANTPEGKWLMANAYKSGFIIRYQEGKENLTGYKYEPWHIRYVGADLAVEIQKNGQTLEQFFGLAAATGYTAQSYQLSAGT
ncbi:MAG TPA: D-alanyl-D-alanine carboxypeptidase family protein [Candidatus Saccharimonadales bacterium]|nr:D-alanyl-D-alanine carboxypeptidase family protein [Candidatus Saccharimonadales bacterium]